LEKQDQRHRILQRGENRVGVRDYSLHVAARIGDVLLVNFLKGSPVVFPAVDRSPQRLCRRPAVGADRKPPHVIRAPDHLGRDLRAI